LVPPKNIPLNDTALNKSYPLNIDSNGFIENGNNTKKFEGNEDLLIIFFGGSTTECLYVTEKNRFPSILERNLSKKFNRNIKVLNGGVSGNNSLHSLLNLISKGIILKPDYVVLMHNANDLSLLRKTGSYWISPASRSIIQISPTNYENKNVIYLTARKIKNILIPNIYGFVRLKIQNKVSNQDDFKGFRNKKKIDFENIKKMYVSSLKSFINLSRAWDIEPILMTQFNRINYEDEYFTKNYGQDDLEEFIEEYKVFNEILKQVAKSENVTAFDLANEIPSNKKYIYDSLHLTEAGSIFVGEILTNFFEKKLKENL